MTIVRAREVCSSPGDRMRFSSSLPLLALAGPALAASIRASKSFDLKKHLGNLSPQFEPSFGLNGGLGVGMPEGCSLEQVQLVCVSVSRPLYLCLTVLWLSFTVTAHAYLSRMNFRSLRTSRRNLMTRPLPQKLTHLSSRRCGSSYKARIGGVTYSG